MWFSKKKKKKGFVYVLNFALIRTIFTWGNAFGFFLFTEYLTNPNNQ